MSATDTLPISRPADLPVAAPAMGAVAAGIDPSDELELPAPKRMVVQYRTGADKVRVLNLYYGDKDVSFDDPAFFAFGETLARQSRFRAGAACGWGAGYGWDAVAPLLLDLLEAGILVRADASAATPALFEDRTRPSPLPPAPAVRARSWTDCAAITQELTGRAVDPGHLELIVPMFRIAHIAVDRDGRQVGEANVFPRALRLEAPTEWLACTYPGTRYRSDRPMNATALKAMRTHWPQMMSVLLAIRSAFLKRFPEAADGWTVGHVERLAALVLAVPTYALVRCDKPVATGDLHPVLSSVFRVTDGLRMAMHQMMFVPVGESTVAPETRVTVDDILDYAERNHAFHSETGVCAGPRIMVREFAETLILGSTAVRYADGPLDAAVADALSAVEAAFDYGLLAMRAHAALFAVWPATARAYRALAAVALPEASPDAARTRNHLAARMTELEHATYLGREDWCVDRERAYDDMYVWCGRGLGRDDRLPARDDAPPDADLVARVDAAIRAARDFGSGPDDPVPALAAAIADYLVRERALLTSAAAAQDRVNDRLGRAAPARAFASADVDIHNRLQGVERPRLPYLLDDLADLFGIGLSTSREGIEIGAAQGTPQRWNSAGALPAGQQH